MITLKLATSLDGRIATAAGESRWITGEAAREQVHRLRAAHDAVLVGVETALADDPELTVRLPGYDGRQPARVVLDSRQRLEAGCRLVATAREVPTFVVATAAPAPHLAEAGVHVLTVRAVGEDRPELNTVVQAHGRE
jgi:diaminohydroxyphosphoribosylaminopyrimidine deaminase/5-amino-6-(5-phosphoribosylamino)uracil reductase